MARKAYLSGGCRFLLDRRTRPTDGIKDKAFWWRLRPSERWRPYPHSDHKPKRQQRPGKNVYPENGFGAERTDTVNSSEMGLDVTTESAS